MKHAKVDKHAHSKDEKKDEKKKDEKEKKKPSRVVEVGEGKSGKVVDGKVSIDGEEKKEEKEKKDAPDVSSLADDIDAIGKDFRASKRISMVDDIREKLGMGKKHKDDDNKLILLLI